jgi:hypothetical protein
MTTRELNTCVKVLQRRLNSEAVALLRKCIAQAPTELRKGLKT